MGLARYAGRRYGKYKERREASRKEKEFYRQQARDAYNAKKARLQRQSATTKERNARAKGWYIAQHGTFGWIRYNAKKKRAAMNKKAKHHRRR